MILIDNFTNKEELQELKDLKEYEIIEETKKLFNEIRENK